MGGGSPCSVRLPPPTPPLPQGFVDPAPDGRAGRGLGSLRFSRPPPEQTEGAFETPQLAIRPPSLGGSFLLSWRLAGCRGGRWRWPGRQTLTCRLPREGQVDGRGASFWDGEAPSLPWKGDARRLREAAAGVFFLLFKSFPLVCSALLRFFFPHQGRGALPRKVGLRIPRSRGGRGAGLP